MDDPVLVEATRGGAVESRHRGSFAVVAADGRIVLARGDVSRPVFPRSAVKAIQALPLVETGAADRFGYSDEALALAQASHGGEPGHVAGVARMLAAAGLDAAALECGAHPPSHGPSAAALVKAGEAPSALHNNCSGKHAGFLATARMIGAPTGGYIAPDHPVQRLVRDALGEMTGFDQAEASRGLDGCSIPTYAVPLLGLARAFARLAAPEGLPEPRAAAARRLYRAAVGQPWAVAGTGRFCTEVMGALKGAALIKTGAEGVFCAALAGPGLGIALKVEDGATRASEAAMAELLARLLPEHEAALARHRPRRLVNWRGLEVGVVRAVPGAFGGL